MFLSGLWDWTILFWSTKKKRNRPDNWLTPMLYCCMFLFHESTKRNKLVYIFNKIRMYLFFSWGYSTYFINFLKNLIKSAIKPPASSCLNTSLKVILCSSHTFWKVDSSDKFILLAWISSIICWFVLWTVYILSPMDRVWTSNISSYPASGPSWMTTRLSVFNSR